MTEISNIYTLVFVLYIGLGWKEKGELKFCVYLKNKSHWKLSNLNLFAFYFLIHKTYITKRREWGAVEPHLRLRSANSLRPEQSPFRGHRMPEADCVNRLTSSSVAYQQLSGLGVFPF